MIFITRFYKKKLGSSFTRPITKKDVFYAALFSPFTILICINIIYLIHASYLFNLKGKEWIVVWIPVLFCILPVLFYFYNSYQQRILYLFTRDKKNNNFLSLCFITMACLLCFITDSVFLIAFIILFNSIIFVLIYLNYEFNRYLFYNIHINIEEKFIFFNNVNKIKLAILNPYNETSHLTFLFDMKCLFHSQYVLFNGYKISYSDLSNLELNFNKTLYNFNDDELKIVEMYAIN